jgi:hypothetical protein
MLTNISKRRVSAALTLMLSGRAMTLLFLADVGGGAPGDPPSAWLMPLVGDAIIGVLAPVMAWWTLRARTPGAWATVLGFHAVAIWDACAAFLVHTSVPWPSFFMVEIFGSSMFVMASLMHLLAAGLLVGADVRPAFGRDAWAVSGKTPTA